MAIWFINAPGIYRGQFWLWSDPFDIILQKITILSLRESKLNIKFAQKVYVVGLKNP